MLAEMLKKEPQDVFLNFALAVEYIGEQRWEEAEKQLLRTLEMDKDYLACYYQLGKVSEKMNKEDKALEYYKSGIPIAKKQNNQNALNELNEAVWLLE
jgi:tetratricopeptide (TPR) repeat protein